MSFGLRESGNFLCCPRDMGQNEIYTFYGLGKVSTSTEWRKFTHIVEGTLLKVC